MALKWEWIHSFGFQLNLSCILFFFNIQRAVEVGYWVGSWPGQHSVPCGHLRALAKPLEFDPDWNAVISPPAKTVFASKPGDGERVYSLLPSPAWIFHFALGSMPSHRCFHNGTLGKYSVCLFVFLNLKKVFCPGISHQSVMKWAMWNWTQHIWGLAEPSGPSRSSQTMWNL